MIKIPPMHPIVVSPKAPDIGGLAAAVLLSSSATTLQQTAKVANRQQQVQDKRAVLCRGNKLFNSNQIKQLNSIRLESTLIVVPTVIILFCLI